VSEEIAAIPPKEGRRKKKEQTRQAFSSLADGGEKLGVTPPQSSGEKKERKESCATPPVLGRPGGEEKKKGRVSMISKEEKNAPNGDVSSLSINSVEVQVGRGGEADSRPRSRRGEGNPPPVSAFFLR